MRNKLEVTLKVENKFGIHVRPASCIAKILQGSQSKVTLTYKGETINARSIMNLMILTIPKSAKVQLCIEGVDAKETMEKLISAFNTRFGEEG